MIYYHISIYYAIFPDGTTQNPLVISILSSDSAKAKYNNPISTAALLMYYIFVIFHSRRPLPPSFLPVGPPVGDTAPPEPEMSEIPTEFM